MIKEKLSANAPQQQSNEIQAYFGMVGDNYD